MSLARRSTTTFSRRYLHFHHPELLSRDLLTLSDQFLDYFFTRSDAKFFRSLGLNGIRIP